MSYQMYNYAIAQKRTKDMTSSIDTEQMCSHLKKKLFEENGVYHPIWLAMQDDPEVTYVLRQRQLHVYRNGQKVLVLAGKAAPKILNERDLLIQIL